jgi:hypothetical protein
VSRREELGQLVRETWVGWAAGQPAAKPSWLVPWEALDDGQREVDMRIGEAVAASERERIAELAGQVEATYDRPCPSGYDGCTHQDTPFADLIRSQQ